MWLAEIPSDQARIKTPLKQLHANLSILACIP